MIIDSLPLIEDAFPANKPQEFAAKKKLYVNGSNALYLVQEGVVRVYRNFDDGSQVHVDMYRNGHLFGESCLGDVREPGVEYAVAVTDCKVFAWPSGDLRVLLTRPEAAAALARVLFENSHRRFQRLTWGETLDRFGFIRETILDLAVRVGVNDGAGGLRIPGMTHEVIATMVGSSREGTTQHLGSLRKQGLIRTSRKQIRVFPERFEKARGAAA